MSAQPAPLKRVVAPPPPAASAASSSSQRRQLSVAPAPFLPNKTTTRQAYFPATTSSSSTTNARSSSKHVPSGAPPVTQKKYIEGFKPFVQAAKLIKDIKQYKETRERVDKFDRDFNSKPWISPQMKLVIATGVAVHLVLSFIRWRTDPEHFSFYDWGLGQKDPVLDF
eukprot:CAMPEP_0178997168 /NCGR_PEP_ID=MMETSP0795-20121207/8777_1 /TAXON_ID=88552 /ORGANISM="Amoebophrya sp., Strain Ameob2" /LENGTH=167 /DNA_ID=CAMNT_0020689645 /DNA_START=128 /DNA_END=631 /DNA_ORIENTATION=-